MLRACAGRDWPVARCTHVQVWLSQRALHFLCQQQPTNSAFVVDAACCLCLQPVPALLEIPSKDSPYDPNQDSLLRRVKHLLGLS
jgi:hypothetical protein